MIDGIEYIRIVKVFYQFLVDDCGYKLINEVVRGNVFYEVKYRNTVFEISISYENIEDYFLIFITKLDESIVNQQGKNDILYLNKLNEIVHNNIGKLEIELNNLFFSHICTHNVLERKILKNAKDLRLYLKYYNR